MPDIVVRDSPVQVRPIVVRQVLFTDSLQQQVCTVGCEVRYVHVFLRGGARPPPTDNLCMCPPWDISVPVPFLVVVLFLLCLRLCLLPVALCRSCFWSCLLCMGGGGVASALSPCFSPPYSSSTFTPSYATPTPIPWGILVVLSVGCQGWTTRCASPRR